MNLHAHLLPNNQQSLNDLSHFTIDLPLLQILDHLVTHEKVHIVVVFILLGQTDKIEHCLQRRRFLSHFFDDELDCLHQHVGVFPTHTQTYQQLENVQSFSSLVHG